MSFREILLILLADLLESLDECQEEGDSDFVLKGKLRNPRPKAILKTARAVKKEMGLKGFQRIRRHGEIVRGIYEVAQTAEDAVLDEIVAEFRAVENQAAEAGVSVKAFLSGE